MPTYRYQCTSCEAIHEYFHGMSEKPRKKCPDCGRKMERLIGGGGGVLLKGSGFHNTDYRSKSYQDAAKKDAPKPASGGDGKKAKSDKKPKKKSD